MWQGYKYKTKNPPIYRLYKWRKTPLKTADSQIQELSQTREETAQIHTKEI